MSSRLPKWVIAGAFILALSAGMINAVILSAYTGDPVSHMTGNITNFAIQAVHQDKSATTLGLLILSFVAGACLSGAIIGSETLKLGRRYGIGLIIQSMILLFSWFLFKHNVNWGLFSSAFACGLQNAMVSTYSGATIRTTHMTGILSDLGSILGNRLCRRPINRHHALLLVDILCGFISGVVSGVLLYTVFDWNTLLFSVGICFTSGLLYLCWRYYLFFSSRKPH